MTDLKMIASEIREVISDRQQQLGLVFEEDNHIYTMRGRTDYPSVSKILKKFYKEFPLDEAALKKSGGDPEEAERLKESWAAAGDYSTNMGSRVHFLLEKELIERNGSYKELRQPVYQCDLSQINFILAMFYSCVCGKLYAFSTSQTVVFDSCIMVTLS